LENLNQAVGYLVVERMPDFLPYQASSQWYRLQAEHDAFANAIDLVLAHKVVRPANDR
jgi:hypothetical protein